jgi:hypothetical protein
MVTFHPTGPSQRITLSGMNPQTVEMQGLPQANKVLRIVAATYPATGLCYLNLGTGSTAVSTANGMPVDLGANREQFVGVGDETHIALCMGSTSNFDILMTPGEMV